MLKHSLIALFAGSALVAGAPASGKPAYEPIYITDGQYTATLQQRSHHWTLQPLRGDVVDITDHSKTCGSSTPMPTGLWYVSQDDRGRVQLVAPSVTALPAGFPQHVAVLPCGETSQDSVALFVPPVALHWISDYVGSVLIAD